MYLVLLRCTSDDLPLRTFADRPAAMAFALALDPEDPQVERVCAALRIDVTPICVYLVEFTAAGGFNDAVMVKDYEDEGKEEAK